MYNVSEGRAGAVHGGDRLPWVIVGDVDNYEPQKAMSWQVHVYGAASPELKTWCQERGLPLYVFAWRPQYGQAGLAQDALYLIRPDTYVALSLQNPTPEPYVTNTDYTRPEQVQAVVRSLERTDVRLVLWSLELDTPQGKIEGDHLGPLRVFLRTHYQIVKTFADGDQVWIDGLGEGEGDGEGDGDGVGD